MKKKKKLLKFILIVIVALILIAAAYFAYVFLSYKRIPDNQFLDTDMVGALSYFREDANALNTDKAYNIMTYNIGFGAYTDDYSSFLDGGNEVWAKSKEGLIANVCEIAGVINRSDPDFVFLQEVDLDGTRTYHVDEVEIINNFLRGYYYDTAICYDSAFMFYPPTEPSGANKSAIVTYSAGRITKAVRRSLPIATDFSKFFDYDRCYSVSKVLLDNDKSLCLFNVHLSAYADDPEIRSAQLNTLFNDMASEYKLGNYVICGGDFNHCLRNEVDDNDYTWAQRFPREELPKGFLMAIDYAQPESVEHNSCRNANEPYNEKTTYTTTIDGFIVSDNIRVNYYTNAKWNYKYSDHDPVIMQFFFKK
ncbi:MAG: endonuclease/exonuclease/phosphatase family protein [Lachnospiraceae bacterium]|nr:endonuclease/exonuclease/phosphatase family protein [Lachnospiraceae bacterium]